MAGGGTNSGAGGFPATQAALGFVGSVDIAAAGNLYLTEGPRVRKVDSSGNITTLAQVTFFGGSAVRADRAGLGLVRRVDAAGQVTTVAGNGRFRSFPEGTPAALAFIKSSSFVAVSPDGLLHYSDDRRARRVERDGGVITVAGTDWNSASTCRASRPPPPRQMRVD